MADIKKIQVGSTEYDILGKQMTGASSSAAGSSGAVPAPAKGDQGKFLRGDGTWQSPGAATYSMDTTTHTLTITF